MSMCVCAHVLFVDFCLCLHVVALIRTVCCWVCRTVAGVADDVLSMPMFQFKPLGVCRDVMHTVVAEMCRHDIIHYVQRE